MVQINTQARSPQEIIKLGEQIYFEKKDNLEREHNSEYAVIDVDSKEILINGDKLKAIQEAQAKFPNKLFYIVQIGNLQQTTSSINEVKTYGWPF